MTAQTVMPLPVAMKDKIPEVISATRLAQEHMTVTSGDKRFLETFAVTDPNFLQMVPLPRWSVAIPYPAVASGRHRGVSAHREKIFR